MVLALTTARSDDEAVAASSGPIEAAEGTGNPYALSFALLAYAFARRDTDQIPALEAAPGTGDRPRQRLPRQRVTPDGNSGPPRGRTW